MGGRMHGMDAQTDRADSKVLLRKEMKWITYTLTLTETKHINS